MKFIVVTEHLREYRDPIDSFLRELNAEYKFFSLSLSRIMASELVIVSMDGGEIAGVAGIERKWGIVRGYIMVQGKYQQRSLGVTLFMKLLSQARRRHDYLVGLVDVENTPSLRLGLATGYRLLGRRGNLYYILNPFNTKGLAIYCLSKAMFPLVKVADIVRR